MISREDTIAAIATPLGEGGLGVIRVSGARAIEVVSSIFHKKAVIPAGRKPALHTSGGPGRRPSGDPGSLMMDPPSRPPVGVLDGRDGPDDLALHGWTGPPTTAGDDDDKILLNAPSHTCHVGFIANEIVIDQVVFVLKGWRARASARIR